MRSPYWELAKDIVLKQQALTSLERVVDRVLLGECICREAPEARQGFRCPVHCGGSGPCAA